MNCRQRRGSARPLELSYPKRIQVVRLDFRHPAEQNIQVIENRQKPSRQAVGSS